MLRSLFRLKLGFYHSYPFPLVKGTTDISIREAFRLNPLQERPFRL